jgi:hypothetical protein
MTRVRADNGHGEWLRALELALHSAPAAALHSPGLRSLLPTLPGLPNSQIQLGPSLQRQNARGNSEKGLGAISGLGCTRCSLALGWEMRHPYLALSCPVMLSRKRSDYASISYQYLLPICHLSSTLFHQLLLLRAESAHVGTITRHGLVLLSPARDSAAERQGHASISFRRDACL